jgi:hypothetical protein
VGLNISLVWEQTNYTVTFQESGLPSGTPWEVSLGVLVGHSSNGTIALRAPNDTYHYTVQAVSGYNVTSSGNLTVDGAPVLQLVAFTSQGLPTQSGTVAPPINGGLVELGIVALAAFLVVLAIVLEMRYRRAAGTLAPDAPAAPPPGEPPVP